MEFCRIHILSIHLNHLTLLWVPLTVFLEDRIHRHVSLRLMIGDGVRPTKTQCLLLIIIFGGWVSCRYRDDACLVFRAFVGSWFMARGIPGCSSFPAYPEVR